MSLTTRVLIGLVAGLTAGILIVAFGPPGWQEVAMWIEPVGTLWTRGLQMTVLYAMVQRVTGRP
jgi:Na+/H+-dicarboxylate symporter